MPLQDLEAFASDCLAALDEKRRDVIRRRYGLNCDPETLNAIGKSRNVCRAYIEQLQKGSLQKLSDLYRDRAERLVSDNLKLAWERTRYGMMLAKKKPLQDPMSGAYLLAWHVTTGKVRKLNDWLESYAFEYEACWIDRRIDGVDDEVRRLREAAGPLVKALAKPWAVNAIAEQLDCPQDRLFPLLTAAFPKQRWIEYSGYIFHGSNTRRPRRAAMLHAVLKLRMDSAVTPIRTAGEAYRTWIPTDPCNERDLLIVARENEHLFLEVGSANLAAIGRAPAELPTIEAAPSSEGDSTDAESLEPQLSGPESNNATLIANLLRREGPLRLSAIMESLDIPKGTVSGTIGQNYQFVRVLPGTYALDEQVATINLAEQTQAEALFNESEVLRIYIRARFAGEPFDLFPLWGWEFEYQLALWAERHRSDLLPALLAVAHPQHWPAPGSIIDSWLQKKGLEAKYETGPLPKLPWKDATRKSLDARHVLAALLLGKDRGHLSVVSCSMVMGADGLDSSVGSLLLMLLVATGCVATGSTWQSAHQCTELAERWSARLGEDLANHGQLDWSSASARAFLAAAREWGGDDSAWFGSNDLAKLLARLDTAASAPSSKAEILSEPTTHPSAPTSEPLQVAPPESGGHAAFEANIVTTEQLRERAKNKDPEAMYLLSQRTRIGDGTPTNLTMAIYWLRRAALLGHSAAQGEVQTLPTVPLPPSPAGRIQSKNTHR